MSKNEKGLQKTANVAIPGSGKRRRRKRRTKQNRMDFPANSLMMSSEVSMISVLTESNDPSMIHASRLKLYRHGITGFLARKSGWKEYFARLGKSVPVLSFYNTSDSPEPEFSFGLDEDSVVYDKGGFEFGLRVGPKENVHLLRAETQVITTGWIRQLGKTCKIEKVKVKKRKNKLELEREMLQADSRSRPDSSPLLLSEVTRRPNSLPSPGSPTGTTPPLVFENEKDIQTSKKVGKDMIFYQDIVRKSPYNLTVEQKEVKKWISKDVLLWLSFVRVSYTNTAGKLYGKAFFESKIDGAMLTEFIMKQKEHFSQIFHGLGIKNPDHQLILKTELEKLERLRYFDITKYIVERKVERMFLRHLNPADDHRPKSLGEKEDPQLSEKHKEQKIGKRFPEFVKYCQHFHDYQTLRRTIHYILTKYERVKRGRKVYKIKFILTENIHDWWIKQVRKFLGKPLLTLHKIGFMDDIKFGMYHAAVSIGPLQMEYVDNSLVLVRSISSENVILCVDVGLHTVEDVEEFSGRLAREIVQWNRDYTYEQVKIFRKKKRRSSTPFKQYLEGLWSEKCETVMHANCQEFVEYIVEVILGIRLEFSKDINKYLRILKKRGHSEMLFEYTNEFGKKFQLSKKYDSTTLTNPIRFMEHRQLDELMQWLLKIDQLFPLNYSSEYELLKGFDRAFWMKHLQKFKKVEKNGKFDMHHGPWAPHDEGCPFNINESKKFGRRKRNQKENQNAQQ